jgi:glycosyltransferase involved in cell wall biosynthesis
MKSPKVSILMTIYNHQNYLKHSIKSIINQSHSNLELIAIDNGSTDHSKKILKDIKNKKIKKFFLKKNIGRTKCLNFGLKKCTGEFIAILDSDDASHKNRILLQLKEFNQNKEIWMVATDFNYIDQSGKIIMYPKQKFNLNKDLNLKPRFLLLSNPFVHSSMMYRSLLLKKIGNYPSSYIYSQDYAFYLKTFLKYKIKFLDKVLVDIRAPHKKSESVRILNSNLATIEHLKLLTWSIFKFNTSFEEKFLILTHIIIKIIKICLPNSLINKRFKILN